VTVTERAADTSSVARDAAPSVAQLPERSSLARAVWPHLIDARCMDRRDGEPERLKALVEGLEWAPAGTGEPAAMFAQEVGVGV
jgi:hypothetical protein